MFHVKHPEAEALAVSRETQEKLEALLALLKTWNTKINLVGERDDRVWWKRHVLDSLQIAPLLPPGVGPLIDLGSGAGFPGLVLAIAVPRPVHLIEADHRKAVFLSEAARILALPSVSIHSVRIEAASTMPPAAVITARALAPLPDLLRYAHRLLAPGGVAVFPKGRSVISELTAAAAGWTMRVERFPSRTDPEAVVLRISEISPAGAQA